MGFEKILGHEKIIDSLKEAFDKGKMAGVYLFVGADAIGKRTVAVNFAKYINCRAQANKPCEICISCKKIDQKNSPDLELIEPEGKGNKIGIDVIRQIKKSASLKPFENAYRVFIIDSAQMLTQEASNSFLKILEEAPVGNLFILISSQINSILPTIISRCAVKIFERADENRISLYLEKEFQVDKEKANIIARFSNGAIGAAINSLQEDLCTSKNTIIDKVYQMLLKKTSFSVTEWVYEQRDQLKRDLEYLLIWFRDMLVSKTDRANRYMLNIDRVEHVKDVGAKISTVELERMIGKIAEFHSYVDLNVNMKIIVDNLLCEIDRMGMLIARSS